MRHTVLCLVLAAWLPALCAANAAGTPDEKLPKQALFRHLAEHVLMPLTQDFKRAAGRMESAAKAFCAKPDTDHLATVRIAWRETQSAWQPLEMLQIGPIIERRTQRQVNAWPVRPTLIDPLLESQGPIDAARLEEVGAAGKGLPAIEYLLFPPDTADAELQSTLKGKRCDALQALASHVKAEADGLARDWREPNGGFARQLAEAGEHPEEGMFASADQALSDIANLLIAGLDAVKVRKLGKPLEQTDAASVRERLESWRSGASLDHIRDNLRGFETAFFGAGKESIGLDDYLAGIGRPVLPRLVREDLTAAQTALSAIQPPLQQALAGQRQQVQQVEALHKAVAQLQRRMEDDIADALKVDLGFNANDGD